MSTEKNVGALVVTYDLLKNLLKIPNNHRIVSVYSKPEKPYLFFIIIEGPDMPLIWEDGVIPQLTIMPQKWLDKKD